MDNIHEIELQIAVWLDKLVECGEDPEIIIGSLKEIGDSVQEKLDELWNNVG